MIGDLNRPRHLGKLLLWKRDFERSGGRSSKVEISQCNFSFWRNVGLNLHSVGKERET